MRSTGLLATAFAAALLLSSCAPSATPPTRPTSEPSPSVSMPAFLATPQSGSDRLPTGVADTIGVEDDSTHFQGDWHGREVYLALKKADSVCVVTGVSSEVDSWIAACGAGNEIVTWKPDDGGTVKYLPMTTSATPDGWTRLSDYVFAM